MNTLQLLALPLLLAAGTTDMPAPSGSAPKVLATGEAVPLRDLPMTNVDAREVRIAEVAGKKGTLVLFICNHCPWVKAWQTRIARIGNEALGQGIGVIAVNSNDPAAFSEDGFDEMKARARKLGYRFPYAVDATSDLARAFGATRTPEAFLFDSQGKLVYHGAVDDNARDEKAVQQPWLRQAVQALAGGKAQPVAETKAFGCGIKLRQKASS